MEVPRARLTMELAKIKESQGNIVEAADVLQELQVSGGVALLMPPHGDRSMICVFPLMS